MPTITRVLGTRRAGIAAVACTVGAIAIGPVAAGPADAAPAARHVCTIAVTNPSMPLDTRGTTVTAQQPTRWAGQRQVPVSGRVDVTLLSGPQILFDFDHSVRIDWRNTHTKRHGSVTVRGRTDGDASPLFATGIATGPGNVVLTARETRTGVGGSSAAVSRGSCTGQFHVA